MQSAPLPAAPIRGLFVPKTRSRRQPIPDTVPVRRFETRAPSFPQTGLPGLGMSRTRVSGSRHSHRGRSSELQSRPPRSACPPSASSRCPICGSASSGLRSARCSECGMRCSLDDLECSALDHPGHLHQRRVRPSVDAIAARHRAAKTPSARLLAVLGMTRGALTRPTEARPVCADGIFLPELDARRVGRDGRSYCHAGV